MKGRRTWTLEHLAAMAPGDTTTAASPPWQPAQPAKAGAKGKRENEKEKKKISSWVSWWLGQKLFQEQIRGACHCHCHCHCHYPRARPLPVLQHSHTPSALGLRALPRTPLCHECLTDRGFFLFFFCSFAAQKIETHSRLVLLFLQ